MTIAQQMKKEQNLIETGAEVKEGDVLVEEGALINPGVKAVMATFGYSDVWVAKKPVVGILATGTELLEVDEPLEPGDRKSTRLNSSHVSISYAVFCLKKKKQQ